MTKDNIISFSIWGNNPKYIDGLIENIKLQPLIYPDWKIRVYADNSVDINILKELHEKYNIQVRLITDNRGPFYGMYWRFLVNDDETVDKYLIRDSDSRLNWREAAAVKEWLLTGQNYHIMRDHPHHTFPIQGGMWGGTANKFKIWPLIEQWNQWDKYACDQFFLGNIIWPMIQNDSCRHDPIFEKRPFPEHEPIIGGGTFVGQIWENNEPQLA